MPAAETPPTLRDLQFALSRHIRDPGANPPPPGIEDRRLKIYRELFYNNVEGLLAGNFPVIRKTLGHDAWHTLIRAFFRDHRAQTPMFPELAREFLRFLEQRQLEGRGDAPWLLELAHYEWVELALDIEQAAADLDDIDPTGDLLDGCLALSPLAWPLAYRYPVHRIGPAFQPEGVPDQPTFLMVRREGGKVRFSEISPLAYRLLQRISEFAELNGRQQLEALASEVGDVELSQFLLQGKALLEQLHQSKVILGTRNC
ncbi:MAG: putative DNA-binding domain-containing protein [Xanthomonadaceae bacterium]|nr:putative DNA-binding domain-containing protein [Xanthomonadaceae bacterium]